MIHVIVPVKSLDTAKGRLAGALLPAERQALALAMLTDVLGVLQDCDALAGTTLISRDPVALERGAQLGAMLLLDQSDDLNGALQQAARHLAGIGATALLVVHGDIPLVTAQELKLLIDRQGDGVVLAPARDGGTNALFVRPPLALPFLFGDGSLERHYNAALARGLPVRLVQAPGLEYDIDRPADLWELANIPGSTFAQRLVRAMHLEGRLISPPPNATV